jgi:oxygen-dependent protoporphyrinogen oxidase
MDIAIVGGGVTGLASAFYLEQMGRTEGRPVRVTLFERDPRLGGKIVTLHDQDFLIEGGPDSFLNQKPWGVALCRELGLGDQLVPANPDQRNVYLVYRGKLVPFPTGFRLAVPTEWMPFLRSPLLTWRGKARVVGDLVAPARREGPDESLADFLRRRIGREAAERLAGPVMSGIYTADPQKLSVRASWPQFVEMERRHGSLIRAVLRARRTAGPAAGAGRPTSLFVSLQGGMGQLVEALRAAVEGEIHLRRTVAFVQRAGPRLSVGFEGGRGGPLSFDAVILACPAYRAAKLVAALEPDLEARLASIRYVSTASVSLGYRTSDIHRWHPLDGYGFLVPAAERQPITACTWSSTKFAGRAPEDRVLMRAFLGGDGKEEIVGQSDDALIRTVRAAYAGILGFRSEPVCARVFRWFRGNPQYDVGHLDRVGEIERAAEILPGLYLTGSAYRGVSVPDCIRQAKHTAEQVWADLRLASIPG